ncbi:hemolysin III family protein [Bacillaceae bacterium S4-13-58]
MADTHTYTKTEELANAITHGIGALLSIAALTILVIYSSIYGSTWHVVSFTIFGVTMVLLYFSSTLVHSFPEGRVKDLFEIFDHSLIYFFIAGTYTPFLFIIIKGWVGWTLFGVVWALAIGGAIFKAFFVKKFLFMSTILYIIMGWLIVFGWNQISSNLHPNGLTLLITGGLLYTFGAVFYVWRGFKFHHAVWHLFVLAGTATHFFAILLYLLPWE